MSQPQQNYEYVLIGGGTASGYACKELVDLGINKTCKICMISSEHVLPYERPALSKGFLLKKDLELPLFNTCAFVKQRNEMEYYQEHNITIKLSTTVTDIDFKKKIITTNGCDVTKYNKVLLATGCSAIKFSDVLSKQKSGFNHIYYLRDIDDARNIKKTIFDDAFKDKECVVIGGGYIGMEVTSALITNGSFKSITMIFPEQYMMQSRGLFTKEIADKYHNLYTKNGVKFMCNSDDILVDSFEGDKDGNIKCVILKNGDKISADIIIVGIGARPNIDLFKDKLEIDECTKGLKVNKYLQSVSNKDVYICGDIMSFNNSYLDRMIRLEHVRNARSSAIFAVESMTNKLKEKQQKGYEFVPVFYSRVFGQNWIFYGDNCDDAKCDVDVYCKYEGDNKGGDSIRKREFKLCAIWCSKSDVIGILVDTDDDIEREIAENAVRNRLNIKDMDGLIAGFRDSMDVDVLESSKSNKSYSGKKRSLEDKQFIEEQPPKKKQRIGDNK